MNPIHIDTIDWAALAKRYNEKHSKDISFEGSTAFLYSITEDGFVLYFELNVSESSRGQTKVSSKVHILRNKNTGKLSSTQINSSELAPPNPESVAMGKRYILYNLLPDYIEPYLETHSVPLEISCSSSDASAIPLRRMTFTTLNQDWKSLK